MTDLQEVNWDQEVGDCPKCGGTFRTGSKWISDDCRFDVMHCLDCDHVISSYYEPARQAERMEQAEAYLTPESMLPGGYGSDVELREVSDIRDDDDDGGSDDE